MKLFASAQFFGYGPTSNLFTILRTLQQKCNNKISIKLLSNEATEIFHDLNKDVQIELVDEVKLDGIDLIISSFDPFLIINGWLQDISTLYFCNLFWYWNVSGKIAQLKIYKNKLEQLKNNNNKKEAIQLFENIFKEDPHLGITLGYLFASHCFIRSFPKIEERVKELDSDISFSRCNIIMPELKINEKKIPNLIFIQLAGSCNPVMSKEENLIYVRTIKNLIEKLAKYFTDMEFVICVNPTLIEEKIQSKESNVTIIVSLSQRENFGYLKKASAIFTSPGLETIFEANYFKTPIFLLPEQNAGQFDNFKLLKNSGFDVYRYLVDEEFPV